MNCLTCGAEHAPFDNYCPNCGRDLASLRLPAVSKGRRALVRPRAGVMALSTAERALAVGGAATLGVSLGAWLLRRWLLPRIVQAAASALPAVRHPSDRLANGSGADAQREAVDVDTLIWIRRISIRR